MGLRSTWNFGEGEPLEQGAVGAAFDIGVCMSQLTYPPASGGIFSIHSPCLFSWPGSHYGRAPKAWQGLGLLWVGLTMCGGPQAWSMVQGQGSWRGGLETRCGGKGGGGPTRECQNSMTPAVTMLPTTQPSPPGSASASWPSALPSRQ